MNLEFKTVAMVGRIDDPRVASAMSTLAIQLSKSGVRVIADPGTALRLAVDSVEEKSLATVADLIIAIGGDGTILYGTNLVLGHDVPLLGINRGRLGFLADVSPDEMLASLERILAGDFTRESRMLLEARIVASNGEIRTATGLNDVVLQRRETGRMVDVETRIDGRYVNTHAGDGLIIATPTGSTAYSLSCGGPIIEPLLDVVVMVPICPHTLSDRPIVIPASHEIEVVLIERGGTKAEVVVDGKSLGELESDQRLTVSASAERITLIHPPGYDYYDILRSKLHWGHDSRQRYSCHDSEK